MLNVLKTGRAAQIGFEGERRGLISAMQLVKFSKASLCTASETRFPLAHAVYIVIEGRLS